MLKTDLPVDMRLEMWIYLAEHREQICWENCDVDEILLPLLKDAAAETPAPSIHVFMCLVSDDFIAFCRFLEKFDKTGNVTVMVINTVLRNIM
jgi:hypothetical protein